MERSRTQVVLGQSSIVAMQQGHAAFAQTRCSSASRADMEKTSAVNVDETAAPAIETIPAHQRVAYNVSCGASDLYHRHGQAEGCRLVAEHAIFSDVGQDDTVAAEAELV